MKSLEKVLNKTKIDVFTSLSNIHILNDLNKLIDEKNEVLFSNPVFFRSIVRELQMSLSIKLERLLERGRGHENLTEVSTLAKKFLHKLSSEKQKQAEEAIKKIISIEKGNIAEKNRKLRHNIFAHLAKDKEDLKSLRVSYSDYQKTFQRIGEALNMISGAFFDSSTHMRIVGDDRTIEQFRYLKDAKNAYKYLELHENSNHPAFKYLK